MKNKVFGRPLPNSSLPRNAFDRGYNMKLNFSSGMILPTFVQYCVGGSKVKINQKAFLRSAAVNTAAMTSCDFYTDFYYVPLKLLLTLFGQFKTKTNDVHSSAMLTIPTSLPRLSRSDLSTVLQQTTGDIFNIPFNYNADRLVELLGYGADANSVDPVGDVNMLSACAYQKVYFDHYRNTYYEPNDPSAYNLDQFATSGVINVASATKMLTLRYVNYKRDYFGNIYPSLNYLASSAAGMQSQWNVPSSVVGAELANTYGVYNNGEGTRVSEFVLSGSPSYTTFSVQSLRAAFALDKLVRASSYAPQHVKDQYEARYGFKSYQYNGEETPRIGSFKFSMLFDEVVSTADTVSSGNGQPLGDIGGKGVAGSDWQDTISYECKDDCIIIGMTYAIPRQSYDGRYVDKFAQKFLPTDFFQPEFMDLGMQPVLVKDIYCNGSTLAANNVIIGYQPRYSEYKANHDRNFGNFKIGSPLAPFTLHGRDAVFTNGLNNSGVDVAYMKVCPSDMDSIFVNNYDGQQYNDQFFGMFEFGFACVAPMSVHGQPRL